MTDTALTDEGLRERKKRARRAALVEAAQVLVLERGFDAVTVEDVADAAGVSARTFHNYFESKDEAVLGLPDTSVGPEIGDRFVSGGPTGNGFDDMAAVIAALLECLAPYAEGMRRSMEISRREPRLLPQQIAFFDRQREEFRALIEARNAGAAAPIDAELGPRIMLLLTESTATAWSRADYVGAPEDYLAPVAERLRALIGAEGPGH